MDNLITKLYKANKTVFNMKDLALLWKEKNQDNLKSKIAYYVKQGKLIRLKQGVFAIDKNYNPKELAVSIYSPAYISFETVLREQGLIFQHYDSLFVASKWPRTIKAGKHKIIFRKIKDIALYNPAGVINKGNYSIASRERAFLDTIYLFPDYYFDNLDSINWSKCLKIVSIYNNKQLVIRLNKYKKDYAK
jgi:predicted transcriptional regulator of viral defense system